MLRGRNAHMLDRSAAGAKSPASPVCSASIESASLPGTVPGDRFDRVSCPARGPSMRAFLPTCEAAADRAPCRRPLRHDEARARLAAFDADHHLGSVIVLLTD